MRSASRDRVRRDDAARCRALLRQGSKSFHAASLLLPRRVRDAAAAVYAFCRIADDAIDLGPEPEAGLAELHHRLDRIYGAAPAADFIDRALGVTVQRYAIPRGVFEALLEGFAWELEDRRYDSADDLNAYCVRVAATVGVVMARVMGCRDPETLARACDLGVAMQLTNIARDVGEDAARGRLYLPTAWLREAGIDPARWLAAPSFSPALGSVVRRALDAAHTLYRRAESGIGRLPFRYRGAIWSARLIYADIGRALAEQRYDSVTRRAVTSPARKGRLMLTALRAAWGRAPVEIHPVLPEARFLIDLATANRAHAAPPRGGAGPHGNPPVSRFISQETS
ncbi:MAG: phytoene/squalene synthase family protein [Gemmatimonadota bacterium]|nr:MAG: phytoene/squalene synthase family protein [Gemmatimonadota bacterium]